MALLKLENVTVNYGSINALSGINLEVNEGEIVTLIGSNGAGKSTTMRTIMGLKHCDGGKIFFNGEDITNKDTRVMVQKGIILSPEGRQVFPRFSVEDNLRMGAYTRPDQEIGADAQEGAAIVQHVDQDAVSEGPGVPAQVSQQQPGEEGLWPHGPRMPYGKDERRDHDAALPGQISAKTLGQAAAVDQFLADGPQHGHG